MELLVFSFIIPVYDRPEEIQELLQSMLKLRFDEPFEVVIIEDGSQKDALEVVRSFEGQLDISYLKKGNTGPGDSRNFGMKRAKGNYFIILDSDVLLPEQYLMEVKHQLNQGFVDCFGGPDAAHEDFSDVQKAIDFVMTSFLTTGGIRGNERHHEDFQPRSFNMGLSKVAFESSGGFGQIHPGEDPDLVLRLREMGFMTGYFSRAFVYHKRRVTWKKFFRQVNRFGMVRPILNKWHKGSAKLTYWFPTIFTLIALSTVIGVFFGFRWPIGCLLAYMVLVAVSALVSGRGLKVSLLSVYAMFIQFFGYGFGFLKSTILINFSKREPKAVFPHLFFNTTRD